jgi:hypothetical protein
MAACHSHPGRLLDVTGAHCLVVDERTQELVWVSSQQPTRGFWIQQSVPNTDAREKRTYQWSVNQLFLSARGPQEARPFGLRSQALSWEQFDAVTFETHHGGHLGCVPKQSEAAVVTSDVAAHFEGYPDIETIRTQTTTAVSEAHLPIPAVVVLLVRPGSDRDRAVEKACCRLLAGARVEAVPAGTTTAAYLHTLASAQPAEDVAWIDLRSLPASASLERLPESIQRLLDSTNDLVLSDAGEATTDLTVGRWRCESTRRVVVQWLEAMVRKHQQGADAPTEDDDLEEITVALAELECTDWAAWQLLRRSTAYVPSLRVPGHWFRIGLLPLAEESLRPLRVAVVAIVRRAHPHRPVRWVRNQAAEDATDLDLVFYQMGFEPRLCNALRSTPRRVGLCGEPFDVLRWDNCATLILDCKRTYLEHTGDMPTPALLPLVYYPQAVASLGSRTSTWQDKLAPVTSGIPRARPERFCCLLARNPHWARVEFFDVLHALEPVDGLGRVRTNVPADRREHGTHDWNVAERLYQQYRFVICFENAGPDDGALVDSAYVTEKLVNVLFAGSIPIYRGASVEVRTWLNPARYIDAYEFEKQSPHDAKQWMHRLAEHVLAIERDPERYAAMRDAPLCATPEAAAAMRAFFRADEAIAGLERHLLTHEDVYAVVGADTPVRDTWLRPAVGRPSDGTCMRSTLELQSRLHRRKAVTVARAGDTIRALGYWHRANELAVTAFGFPDVEVLLDLAKQAWEDKDGARATHYVRQAWTTARLPEYQRLLQRTVATSGGAYEAMRSGTAVSSCALLEQCRSKEAWRTGRNQARLRFPPDPLLVDLLLPRLAALVAYYADDTVLGREACVFLLERARGGPLQASTVAQEARNLSFYTPLTLDQVAQATRLQCELQLSIINVASAQERWRRSRLEAWVAGFTRVHRYDAMTGAKLLATPGLPERLATPDALARLQNDHVKSPHELPSYNGLALAYNQILVQTEAFVLLRGSGGASSDLLVVAEDDFVCRPEWHLYGQQHLLRLPPPDSYDVALLGNLFPELSAEVPDRDQADGRLRGNPCWSQVQPTSFWCGLHMYIVTRRGAAKLQQSTFPLSKQVDVAWALMMQPPSADDPHPHRPVLTVLLPRGKRVFFDQRNDDASSLQTRAVKA